MSFTQDFGLIPALQSQPPPLPPPIPVYHNLHVFNVRSSVCSMLDKLVFPLSLSLSLSLFCAVSKSRTLQFEMARLQVTALVHCHLPDDNVAATLAVDNETRRRRPPTPYPHSSFLFVSVFFSILFSCPFFEDCVQCSSNLSHSLSFSLSFYSSSSSSSLSLYLIISQCSRSFIAIPNCRLLV